MLGLGSRARARELIERLRLELGNGRITHKKEVESSRRQNRQLRDRCELLEARLRGAEMRLNEKSEEDEVRVKVDFILRSGLDLQKSRVIEVGDQGWLICISKETKPYIRYLSRVIPHLPKGLKASLLERVQADDAEGKHYLRLFSGSPRIRTVHEMVLDPGHGAIDYGAGVTAYSASMGESITTQGLVAIVNEAKKSISR